MKRAITGAEVVLPGHDRPVPASVLIDGERIAALELGDAPLDADEAIDGRGLVLAPGIVDLGVFATDKPAFHFGGVVRAALMPDQSPVLDDPGAVRFAAQKGKPDIWVHPLGAATKGLEGKRLAELALMQDAGARGVATGRQWIADSGVMHRLMRDCAALNLPLIVHSEDAGLTAKAVASEGEMATRLGLAFAPVEAEALSIARDLMLAEITGAHLHFRQVTTARGLDLIRAAKKQGLAVTCGITPGHLLLSDIAIGDFRTFARLSPPLRSEDDRKACIDAVADGTIDVISSGHDPRGPEDKRLPFADAAPGMAGAETLLALALILVRDGRIGWGRLFDCLAANPARILGLDCGRIEPGLAADLILLAPDRAWRIDTEKMAAAAGNTPFDGLPVEGRVRQVIKGGKRVA